MSYEKMLIICDMLAKQIKEKYPDTRRIFAVARGGLTPAQRIAYKLALPVGIYTPQARHFSHPWTSVIEPIILIEDVVAQGRTYNSIKERLAFVGNPWAFIPLVIDAAWARSGIPFETYGYVSPKSEWVVFPWEDLQHIQEGDRGMFREGTSANSKEAV